MRTRPAISLTTLLTCLLIEGCASHGPVIKDYGSFPKDGVFAYRAKGRPNDPVETLSYAQTAGFTVYPPQSLQAIEQYCAERDEIGTPAPAFTICLSDPARGGLSCSPADCQINAAKNGALCLTGPDAPTFIAYADSVHYIALSPPNQETLFAFCGINLTEIK